MASAQFFTHNLRLVVSEFLDDKFTSLRQVNSPSSWEKFQICCTDMYLIIFLPNFAVFCMFLWISRLCDGAKYQKPWLWVASFTLYKLATKNFHLATIFPQLVAKRQPEDFFNFEPCFNLDTEGTEPIYCPLYRGVHIIEVRNVWFLPFLGPNKLSVIKRCPYYRGVCKERLDCIFFLDSIKYITKWGKNILYIYLICFGVTYKKIFLRLLTEQN